MFKESVPETQNICFSCHEPKPSLKSNLRCELCQCLLCKECILFLEDHFFSFMKKIPEELKYISYCANCYDEKVAPARKNYLKMMEKAKNVYIFQRKDQRLPVIRQSKTKLKVENCPDQKETLLRLAFLAVEQNFNGLLEVKVTSEKVRINGYQKLKWSGTGFPAEMDVARLKKMEK